MQTWFEIYLDNSVNVNTRSMWSSLQSTGEVQKGMRLTSVLQKVHTLRALSVLSLSTYADIRFMVKTNHQYRNSHKHAWNVADAYQHLSYGACKLTHIFSFKEKFQSYEPKLIDQLFMHLSEIFIFSLVSKSFLLFLSGFCLFIIEL